MSNPRTFAFYLHALRDGPTTDYWPMATLSIGLPRNDDQIGWLTVNAELTGRLLTDQDLLNWPVGAVREAMRDLYFQEIPKKQPTPYIRITTGKRAPGDFSLRIATGNLIELDTLKGRHTATGLAMSRPLRYWRDTSEVSNAPSVRRINWPATGWFAL
ncbi:hypothetical protein RM531_08050 [Salinisphaera sp. P385]|uniref:Uncharacterized protein n=1 Tax=Spectribacter acetivorans TaxID=3075603 RepID=A0ABU3B7J3_9GAMM|nr:hypothetical protein [Salinisphaera sp. P385]MDT0618426.1 hypothetical protein [Salinisphaera sp. P385]